jgi:hypothetical protein
MWFNRFFTPRVKVGQVVPNEVQPTLAERLEQLCEDIPIDVLFKSVVIRRFLLTLHWPDIQSLFNAIIYQKRDMPVVTAVNIHTYFKLAGTPPSVCLDRLITELRTSEKLPQSVLNDIEHLIEQLQLAKHIHTTNTQDTTP